MGLVIKNVEVFEKALKSKANVDFDVPCKKTATAIFNRAGKESPKDTGHLIRTRRVNLNTYEFGYTAHYAPHVEYGHRIVVHGMEVGYYVGQRYLKAIVERTKPDFIKFLNESVKE